MKAILARAIALASEKHLGQFDKGGMPYILHPLKVMYFLKTDDLELMAIAVLHDIVEDCDVTWTDLAAAGMTQRIIDGVSALTKRPGEAAAEYFARIVANSDAIKVKLADLRHNSDIRRLKGITDNDVARMKKYHAMYLELKDSLRS